MNEDLSVMETITWQSFQKGDRKAFEKILNLYYPTLLNYGQRLVRDNDFAQDCLQDFFIELWNCRDKLDIPQSIKAYLISSYRRALLKEKTRNFWHQRVTDLDDHYEVEVQFNIETYLIKNEIEHETLVKLKYHLSTLSKRQREALYLRFNQELEYEEISQIMAINHHSAINLVYEALKLLRKNWVMSLLFSITTIIT
ncbi:sigma-70 family RNA polymerase sigma factor [Runella sp.]|jgi:RNA polymerase sigma factor (sigma-70 family)|uniref:RNA polymerase sigma factor n=1 Tax=Runella sp. TaxID=1960881 RepID=UPI00262B7706|nr:sigma-70 family RNA polymerase sigma factor [Runella sp.]